MPWLGGGCLIAYLGNNYPAKSDHAGNLAIFGTSGTALIWAAVVRWRSPLWPT